MNRIISPLFIGGALAFINIVPVSAEIVDFPAKDGKIDLSDAAAWGGTLPSTTDAIELDRNYERTLVFGSSCTFDSFFFTTEKTTNTVEILDPTVTVKLLGASGAYSGLMAHGTVSSAALTLIGGTYDLNNKGSICPSDSYNDGSKFRNYCQMILDNVTVTNAAALSFSSGSFDDRLVIRNKSRIYTAKANGMSDSLNVNYPKGAYFEVSGGSKVYAETCVSPLGRGMANATFLVTGEDSLVTGKPTAASTIFGSTCSNARLIVDDYGELNLCYSYIAALNTHDCGIDVKNNAILRLIGDSPTHFPNDVTAHDVALNVLSGAEFSCEGEFYFGYSATAGKKPEKMSVLVSNAVFSAKTFSFGGRFGSVRVMGAESKVTGLGGTLFNGAECSSLEFADGATYHWNYPYLSAIGTSNNTFAVEADAVVSFGTFNGSSYHSGAGDSAHGNTIRIGSGGKIVCAPPDGHPNWKNYNMTGWDNATIVSNGTLDVAGNLMLGAVGASAETGMANTHNSLVIQGSMPQVKVAGNSVLNRGSVVRFEIPSQGYSNGLVLWTTTMLYRDAGDSIILELAGISEEFVKNLENKFEVTLIKQTFTGSVTLRAALGEQVNSIASKLPKGMRLYFAENDRELRLSAKPLKGILLIVR